VLEWCVRPRIGGQQAEADTQRASNCTRSGSGQASELRPVQCHPVVDVAEWVQAGQEAIEFRKSTSRSFVKNAAQPAGGAFAFALVER
jgi:hypothetical protein